MHEKVLSRAKKGEKAEAICSRAVLYEGPM